MTLKDIATVSGKGGLFKVLAPTKSGVILESLDEAKTRMFATTGHRLSLLNEISIYTTTKEGTVGLDDVLRKVHQDFGDDLGIDGNADPAELKSFLRSVLPDFDENRVYVSDIRKLVKWYGVILRYAPEILTQQPEEPKEEPAKESPRSEKVEKEPAARKEPEKKKESEKKKEPEKKSASAKKASEKKADSRKDKKAPRKKR